MKIAIIGAGGVGGYFGGRLAKEGNHVTFIVRGEHLNVIRKKGLKVMSESGDFTINPVLATDELKKVRDHELIILGVKAWQVKEIAKSLKHHIDENTVILPLQNGVMAIEEISENISRNNILGGLCRIISKIESPGVIRHIGVEPTIIFGELDNTKTDRAVRILDVLQKAGISSFIAGDIWSELWKKFIAICVSGLLAVCRSSYGVVRENQGTRRLMQELLTEIYELALKEGIGLDENIIERMMRFIDTLPYDSTSSLSRDVIGGRPSEIEYQNGTVVRLAEKHGIDVPVNRFIYHCIMPMEQKARINDAMKEHHKKR
jgi:2-dehydropantoate 2-reductase